MVAACEVCHREFQPWSRTSKYCSHACYGSASTSPERERFWKYVNREGPIVRPGMTACWLWTGTLRPDGYGVIGRQGTRKGLIRAHRLSYCIAANIDDAAITHKVVRHACDNPPCVNPEHLLIGTLSDNARDAVARGRNFFLPGSTNDQAKLTEAAVVEIRSKHAAGLAGYRALAKTYGVDRKVIQRIIKRIDWAHVA